MATPSVTDEIAVALQQFQASLSPEQKVQFSTSPSSSPSDVNGVLAFTAEVDALKQRRQARCVASRLQTTLQSVQQFTSIVSTFVSSNPAVAALVWGSIRFTVLVASNWSSFFEKLTTWFMQMQACCPRFSDYQLLYPESTKLQEVLCSFYASLIRFCTKALATVNDTGPLNFARSMLVSFESQFASHLAELQSKSKSVKYEVQLASHKAAASDRQLQVAERKKATNNRRSTTLFQNQLVRHSEQEQAWRKQLEHRHEHARKQKLLNKLSTFDHIAPLKRERKKRFGDTGIWLVGTMEYKHWSASSSSSAFLLSGILGGKQVVLRQCLPYSALNQANLTSYSTQTSNANSAIGPAGKTVLTTCVIDDLNLPGQKQGRKLAFFFCQHDNAVSLDLFAMLRSITRQLLTEDDITPSIEPVLDNMLTETSSEEEMLALLIQVIRSLGSPIFLVIDGFDELARSCCHTLLSSLSRLLKVTDLDVKLFITSREGVVSEIKSAFKKNSHHHTMRCRENDDDIRRYIELSVDQRIEDHELSIGDQRLLPIIKESLRKGADSMFLWVFFQIEELCAQLTDRDIIQTLQTLPKDLPSTYERLFSRIITDEKQTIVKRMLTWALVSKRPLTVMELRDGIAIRPGQRQYERECLVNEADRMISWCCNLLTVDEEDSSVRFPHYSVKEFLLGTCRSQQPSTKLFRFTEFKIDIQICHLCCTYLQFSDFQRQMVRCPPEMPDISPEDILDTALTSDDKSLIAQAWLNLKRIRPEKRKKGHALALNDLARSAMKAAGSPSLLVTQFPLFAYASEYWSWHGSRLTMNFPSEWHSFEKLVYSTNGSITRPLPDINWRDPSTAELKMIAQRDHSALVQILLLKMGAAYLENPAPLLQLLTLAIEHTSFQVLQTVTITDEPTSSTALLYVQNNMKPMEAFELALKGGHAETAAWVLKWLEVIDQNTLDSFIREVRQNFNHSFSTHQKGTRLPQKRFVGTFSDVEKCLDIAERIGPPEILSLLQTCVAESMSGPSYVVDRLCRAVLADDYDTMARRLHSMRLTGVAQLQETGFNTALLIAVLDDRWRHAQGLLIAGADANLRLRANLSILDLAIFCDSQGCHSLLLDHGANPNACGQCTWFSPMMETHDLEDVLRCVPEVGNSHSPLAYAVKLDRWEIAKELIQAGADVKVSKEEDFLKDEPKIGKRYIRKLRSPLCYAIKLNRREVALDLLQAGADLIDIDEDSLVAEERTIDDLLGSMPELRNVYSPLAYAIQLDRQDIVWDFIEAGADVNDIKKVDLQATMDVALQGEDPYRIYCLSFGGYYKRHKEPILYHYPSLQEAFTISQAHFDQSSEWAHLYQQDRLSRDDFHALWTKLREPVCILPH